MKKYLILTLFISLTYLLSAQTNPTTNNATVSTLEDNDKVFVAGDFPYNDADGDPFTQIRIVGLESVGILYYDSDNDNIIDGGEDVVINQVILVADIPRLKFRPNADDNGAGYDSFDFQVHDGNDGYSATRTMTIDVTEVNDEPSFTAGANETVLEDDGPQNVPTWATAISVGPANEAAQTPDFIVSNNNNGLFSVQPAIDAAGNLTYTPAADASGIAIVTVFLHDNGGTANGGDDISPGQNFTITVTAVNDLPTGADNTVSCFENAGVTFAAAHFGYADNDGDAFAQIRVTTVPGLGTLWIDTDSDGTVNGAEIALSAGNVVVIADINASLLKYIPLPGENGSPYTNWDFEVHDGTVYSAVSYTMTIDVLPVNSEPSFTIGADQVVNEDAGAQNVVGWATAISAGAADEEPPVQTLTFFVSNNNNGLFSVQPDVDEVTGNLTYTPAANAFGVATVTLYITDDGGTTNGGDDTSDSQNFTITVNSVNDAPTSTDNSVNVFENSVLTLVTAHFNYSDVESDPFTQIETSTVPGLGTLWIDTDSDGTINGGEVPLAAGNIVPIADISGNRLKFIPNPDENGSPYTTFDFKVHDGIEFSTLSYTMTINVLAVNSEPSFTAGADQVVNEDAGAQNVLTWATAIDPGGAGEGGQTLTFHLSNSLPALFSVQPDVDEITGDLTYTPAADANGVATVDIYLTDDGGVANGGDDTSPTQTFTITVNPVNDIPVVTTNNPLNINEGDINQLISPALLEVSDVDNTPAEIEYTITMVPSSGTLYLSGVPLGLNDTYTQADIDGNALTYSHDGSEGTPDTYTFTVIDGDGGTIGATNFVINIAPVNDAPVFTSLPVTTGDQLVFYSYNITTTDADGNPLVIAPVTIPAWLGLVDNGDGTATLSGTPPGGTPINNPITISVSDGIAPAVTQSWNLQISSSVTADAGPDDITCNNNEYTLNAVAAPVGYTGTWTVIGGSGIFTDPNLPNTLVTGLDNGIAPFNTNTFRWTLSNGVVAEDVWDDVVITNNTVVASVTDINNVCGTDAILQADNALNPGETGLWTVEGAPIPLPVIANPNNRTTAVSGLQYNVNQFRWTLTKGTCSDFAIMNVNVIEVYATAGGPAEICSEPFIILGNDPTLLGGTGLWTVGAGSGTFAANTDPTTTVTGSHQDVQNEYVWTVTVNGCQAQASVFVENNIPTTAVITTPDPSTSCDGTYTIIAVPADATDPNETGYWTTVTPGVVITNPNMATTGVTGLQEGANLFTWHISNGTCSESTADVTINYFLPPLVNAGVDEIICTDDYNLAATPLEAGETGLWTFTTGGLGSTIIDPTSNTTQVINLFSGLNVLQWTVTHDICSADSEVEITNMSVDAIISTVDPLISCTDPSPLITANDAAGEDIANPATPATGSWSVLSGGSVVDSPLSWNTTVSNLDVGNNDYIWTVTNGTCTDTDTITVINSIPTQAYAGKDTIVCSTSLLNLNGNNYNSLVEIGFWRRIAGNATITDISVANTSVTNLDYYCTPWTPDWWTNQAAVNVFEWVIQRGTCESTDQVSVMNGLPETIDAGIDQTVCDNVVNLDALDEASCADDHWWEQLPDVGNYIDPLTGAFIPDNDLNMPFNVHVDNIQDGMTQFIWHKRNNFFDSMGNPIQCELTDTVEITSLGLVEDVQAGPEDATCDDWYTLNATPPADVFTTGSDVISGQWSLIFGAGNFDDDSYYNTTVRNMAAYDNIYRWTVTNETLGCVLSDDVYIHSARPSNASAGPDDTTCVDFAVLSSNVPVRYTSAYWTVDLGSGTIIQNSCTGFTCDAQVFGLSYDLNTFVWHVDNEYTGGFGGYDASNPLVCSVTDTTNIWYRGVTAVAGPDIYECGDFTQLFANDPVDKTGVWSGSGTFDDSGTNTSTLFNDVVRGLTRGKNTFTWTISNESCSDADQTVVWGLLPPVPFANVDQTVCSSDVNLNANDVTDYWSNVNPVPPNDIWQEATATGYWTSSNPMVTFLDDSNFNTTASGISAQTEVAFIWHSLNNFTDHVAGITETCELVDTMLVYNNSVTATAGADIFECGIDLVANSFNLNAVPVIAPLTASWGQISGPASTIVTPASNTTLVTNVFQDNVYIYQWTVSSTVNSVTCTDADNMEVEVRIPSNSVVNPANIEVCVNQAPLVGNVPVSGIGTWSSTSPGTIDDPSNNVTFVDLIQNGISYWHWTIDRFGCTSDDVVTVTNNTVTADADLFLANPNAIDICLPEYNLNATDPDIFNVAPPTATGNWIANLGTTTFDNNSIYNTTVRNLSSAFQNILTWTVTKGSCIESSQITINNNEFLIDANVDQIVCDGTAILDGEQAGTGTGVWTYESGSGGNVVTPSQYDTQVTTIVPGGSSLFRWTVTRNGCVAWDEMTVTNNEVTANAGADQTTCSSDVVNMPAADPGAGITGNWQLIFGGGIPVDPTLYNTSVSGLAPNVNTFRWNVARSICTDSDDVNIINNEPADFILNGAAETCDGNSTISVNAYPPDGSGIWTQTSGSGVIVNDTNINTAITGLEPGNNQYTWTVTNGACTKADFIDVVNNQVIADAGIPLFVCADSVNLAALDPLTNNTQQGNGTWTLLAGNGNFETPTLYNTLVRNMDVGLNTFVWTLTLGGCSDNDIASVTNNAVIANATNQTVCTDVATFDGNNPGSSDGLWTLVGSSGTPTITMPSLNISTVTGLGTGVNTFRWLVNNAAGCADSIDIQIDNGEFLTTAGPDQAICNTVSTLAGQNHGGGYSGYWYVVAGGATVTNSAQFDSPVTGLTPGNNVFRWVVNSADCMAFDEVIIQNNLPTDALIVTPIITDREVCANSAAVEGSNPVFGSGVWTVSTSILGTYFTNSTNHQTVINDLRPGNNVLTWTISNGTCSSVDQITIVNNEVTSVAGPSQTLCADNTSLNATDPSTIYPNQGTGYWTNMTGNLALISNSLDWNTGITNLPIGTTTFRWTVEQGICSEFDEVVIANNSATATATDQTDCNSVFTLNGNDPSTFSGTGSWQIVAGSGALTEPTLYNTTITGVADNSTSTLRWTVDNGTCTNDIDITITNAGFVISAGPDVSACSDTYTFNAEAAAPGTGFWTLVGGNGIISNSTQHDAVVTNLSQGNNVFRWNVTRGVCSNFDDIIVENTNPDVATIAAPGPLSREVCNNFVTIQGNDPTFGTGLWSISIGAGNFADDTNYQTLVTNLNPGVNTYTWTISNGLCSTSADLTITNSEVDAVAGAPQIICADNTFLNATDPTAIYPNQGTGTWTNPSLNGALITNSLLVNTAVTNLPTGTTTFQWTVEQGICSTNDLVQITNSSVTAIANDQVDCDGTLTLDGNDPSTFGGTGYWQRIAGTGIITTSDQYNSTITGVADNSITTLRWTVDNGTCTDDTDITITNAGFSITAGPDVSACADTYTFNAEAAAPGTGFWTLVGGNGIISNSTQHDAVVSSLSQGNNVFRWTVTRGACTDFDEIIIENTNPDVATIASPGPLGRDICTNSLTVQGNDPTFGNGLWSVSVGAGNFADDTNYQTLVTNLNPGVNTFTWTISNGLCNTSADLVINNNEVDAVAGAPQIICADNTFLNATDPLIIYPNQGIGYWTNPSMNGAIISNSNSANTAVSNLPTGTTTFQWTVEEGNCTATDLIQITNSSVTATANNQTDCDGTFILDGNDPSSFGGTGSWQIVAGSGALTESTLYNTTITGVAYSNTSALRWTVDNGTCTDDIDITVENIGFSISAGPDVSDCTDTYTFNAEVAAPGTGFWTLVGGNGVISNSTQHDAVVSGLAQGNNVFRWTVTRGICTNWDEITVENTNPDIAVITAPGPTNREVCSNSVTVQGNIPSFGTGQWTLSAGNGVFADATNFQTLVTGLDPGNNIFTWSIANGLCSTSADVIITNNEVASEAGPSQILCTDTTTLNALNVATTTPFQGVGSWTYLGAGTVIIENSLSETTKVTNLPNGTNTFRWTVTHGNCTVFDDVDILNNSVTATALDAQTCNSDIALSGNIPAPGESGYWDCFTPTVTYDDQTLYNTAAHNLGVGINNFVWTINNADCSADANIVITSIDPIADAGADQNNLCEDFTFMGADNPAPGNGVWTVLAGLGTFTNDSDNGTYVSGIQQGINTYRWTVTESGCVETSDVTIINNLPTVGAGPDQSTCNNNVTLSGTNPGGGEAGVWNQISGIPAIITNSVQFNTTVTGLSNGANIFEWTISNVLCSASDEVTITFNEVIADAGVDNSTCDGTYALMAVDPSPGTGYWEAIGAGTFSDISMFNSTVSGLTNGPNTLRWHQSYAGCSDYNDVIITNNEVSVSAGLDQDLCADNTILVGNNPAATGSGVWTRSGGSGTATNPTFYNSPVIGLSKGVNIFTWTITDGPCANSDEVTIINNEITDVNAGVNQNTCDTYATLSALAPQAGESGYWTVAGGTAVFDNSISYTTDVTGLVQGDNRLVWTLTNGTCNASDTVVVTNNSPSVALVSPDAEICSNIYTLVGNNPGTGETGLWTAEFGASATIVEPTANITTAHTIGAGSNTFRWTISNALCDSFDDIVISNNTITTDAGLDASLCTDTTVLSADNPLPGTGIWDIVNSAGTPTFDNASAYNTIVRNLATGSNIFKWTATKGGCSAWDVVIISNDVPTTADAGPDNTVCDGTVLLSGNNPTVGNGVWTRLGGAGVIASPSNYNTLVTGLSSGGSTFRWSITEGMCESYDDVLITNELVFASAGMNDNICGDSYAPLNGNQPGVGETGVWTVTGGTGVFDNHTLYNTGVTGLSGSENVLTWTVTRGSCSNSANVSIFDNTPSPASVSNNKEVCDDFTVIAGNPPTTGVGVWSVAAGSGDFDSSLANTTTVRNIGPDINIYRWTITNGTCTDAADITITNNSVTAVVGDSIFVCGTDAFLNGNEPTAGQTGVWTRTAGTGLIVNSALYNTAVTNLNVGINKFRWSISNGTCDAYADLVVTNNLYDATASVAGPTVICVDSADLLGNIPIQGSVGHWEVFAGAGVFSDPNSPTTRVNALNKGENTLRWFITKHGCSNFADVSITNNMVNALAGTDVITCGNDANLSANELLSGETGLWTIIGGSGTIVSPSDNETVITNQSDGVSVYQWTVNGNGCTDNDIVQVNENSFLIEAGPAQTVCNTNATLSGENPTPGTGLWTTGSGVTINSLTDYVTTVTGLQDNSPHTFRWTVTKNGCTAWDEVVVTNNLVHANAGNDKAVCFANTILNADNPVAGNGLWNITSGSGTITTPSYFASPVTGLSSGTITLTWTVVHENCTDADNMVITNNMVLATAGVNQAICDDFAVLDGDIPQAGGYGIWTTAGGPGIVQTPSAYDTQVTGLQRGVNTFRWTVYENTCTNGGDLVQVINNTFDANAGLDQTLNPLQTSTYFNAELLTNQSGQWSILSGSGLIHTDSSPTSYVYNMPTGTNIFTWAVHNNLTGCSDDDEVAIIVANFVPYAGEDQIVCTDTAKLNARVETGASSHTWSLVSGSGVFDDIYDSNTVVRGISHGANVYRWTVTFIGYSNYDDVIIFNDSIFASAGDDAITCAREHTMNAQQILDPDSSWWSPVGFGGGTIVENSAWNTLVTGLVPGDSYFEWFVSNGNCISRDTVILHYNLPPIAQFETDPTEFCAPALVTIQNTSTQFGGQSPPDEFEWVIEDDIMPNTFDINGSFSYNFTNTAEWDSIYHIRLVAIDHQTTCTDTFYSNVIASAGPKIEFEVRPDEPLRIPNAVFTFQNKSDINLIAYEWDFGNGDDRYDYSYVPSFDYEYNIPGTYIITLDGTSSGQCNGTYIDTVIVLPACPFSWNDGATIAEGCQELTVEFYNDVNYADDPMFTLWHFYGPNDDVPGNVDRDSTSFVNDPIYEYTEAGVYHPYITAWNESCGSEANPYFSRVDTVIVYTKPIVDFDVAPRLIMLPEQLLTCFNYSEYGDRYFWDFGDDSISSDNFEEHPQHLYSAPGLYDISLAVWTEHDCFASDTLRNIVFVEQEGTIEFPTAFTPSPDGANGGVYPCGEIYRVDKDNLNDVFYPKQTGVDTYTLEIYNRWGEKIFISNDLCTGWDGYVDGVLAPQDVYVWKVSVTYRNGEPERKYGSVTLLR